VGPRAESNRPTFPFGHQQSDVASPERGVSPLQASFAAGSGGALHSTQGLRFVETGRISDMESYLKVIATISGCFQKGFF